MCAVSKLRSHLTYANVMATFAVFVALGGTAYAVAANSVGTAQLKDSAVTTSKIAKGAVTSGKIADGTLAWSDLGGSLRYDLRDNCPYSMGNLMNKIGAVLCIERFARGPASQQTASLDCAKSQLRMPSPTEMQIAGQAGVLQDGTQYWTDFLYFDSGLNEFDGRTVDSGGGGGFQSTDNKHYFACVMSPTNL
jgi:hypothetical protein